MTFLPRTYLFVPGDRADMLTKALTRGADALVVDLEDAVAPSAKDAARETAAQWLRSIDPGTTEVWVRVNADRTWRTADLPLASLPVVRGVVLPKVESADDVEEVAQHPAVAHSLYDTRVIPLIESAVAQLAVEEIAEAHGVHRLGAGEVDFTADLGITTSDDERELVPFRMSLVTASVAARIAAPAGGVSLGLADTEEVAASSERLVRLGFGARLIIHPGHVAPVHAAFTPTPEQEATARDIVARATAAAAKGVGVVVDANGKMVDEAVVRQAKRLLARIR